MEAGGLGRGAWCLPGKAKWCTPVPQRASASTRSGATGSCQCTHFTKLNSNKPRYHKNSRAYKVPQFLERGERIAFRCRPTSRKWAALGGS
jgi:hypothetical protein